MTTFHPDPRYGDYVAYMKGAPDVVLGLCNQVLEDGVMRPLTDERRRNILEENEALAANALRVLGVAFRPLKEVPDNPQPEDSERDLTFVGLLGMIDPARPEVAPAIETARHAGIETVMITGDYLNTAVAIGKEIGLLREGDRALTGAELDRMDDAEFEAIVEDVAVYARVSPQHKVRIVDGAQGQGARGGHDRRRRQRRPGAQAGQHRRGHGHHRHRRLQRDGRHGADRRQLCQHRLGHRAGARHLLQHPQVRLLPALLQHGRDHHPASWPCSPAGRCPWCPSSCWC